HAQIDKWSNLHVFYQDAARTFRYFVIMPNGAILTRQTWELGQTKPGLTMNSEGRISVTGGVRRVSASDLPPPELLSEKTRPSEAPIAEGDKRIDAEKAVK